MGLIRDNSMKITKNTPTKSKSTSKTKYEIIQYHLNLLHDASGVLNGLGEKETANGVNSAILRYVKLHQNTVFEIEET